MAYNAFNPAIMPAGRQRRVGRYPRHTFNLKFKPFQIVPCFIAPVLPGETMKNAVLQARAISDPIKNDLVGAWLGFDLFYVKLRDLAGREDFMNMMVDLNQSMSAYDQDGAHSVPFYTAIGGVKWVEFALNAVVGAYYRDQDDAPAALGDYPVAAINDDNWLHSFTNDDPLVTSDPQIQGNLTDLTGDESITASEIESALLQWQMLRANNLVDMTYEDYLKAQGINIPDPEDERPELLRTVRAWTYPANGVAPDTGDVRSVWSWSVAERADKARLFKEPGFIFGVTVCRPKIYRSLIKGNAAAHMKSLLAWLPKQVQHDMRARMQRFVAGTGPLPSNTDDYWFDIGDLLSYGDQFTNWAIDQAEFAMPTAAGEFKYPTEAMVDDLFATVDVENIRMDGVLQLNIASTVTDITPRGSSSVNV